MEARRKFSVKAFIKANGVPIMFFILCGLGVLASGSLSAS